MKNLVSITGDEEGAGNFIRASLLFSKRIVKHERRTNTCTCTCSLSGRSVKVTMDGCSDLRASRAPQQSSAEVGQASFPPQTQWAGLQVGLKPKTLPRVQHIFHPTELRPPSTFGFHSTSLSSLCLTANYSRLQTWKTRLLTLISNSLSVKTMFLHMGSNPLQQG